MHIREDGWGARIVPLGSSLKSRASSGGVQGAKRLSGFWGASPEGESPCRVRSLLKREQLGGFNMKMIKSLVLGSAAALVAMGGGQAADLPVKAKAVEYVRVCSLYGAGFWYIPGTDTCIKIGGYLRVDTTFDGGGAHVQPAWSGASGQRNRYFDDFVSRSRMQLQVDTRTATEYGVVRTFAAANFQFKHFGTSNAAGRTFV